MRFHFYSKAYERFHETEQLASPMDSLCGGPLFFCGHMGLIALVHLPVARRLDAPLIRTKKERAESRMHVPQILGQFADFYLLFFFIHCYQCFIGVEMLVIRRRASIDYIYRVKKS